MTENNYHAAIEILQQRFGKPQQIISAHMDELLKISACTGDKPSQLRFVYDKFTVHVRALEALGVNSSQYESLLITRAARRRVLKWAPFFFFVVVVVL